ncbi:MAG: N-formylglutamate amidohydrolase [Planctomycetes bacterium]|nr:N-formylglutamate amidohydrolase [Planctomycetota bacterium]
MAPGDRLVVTAEHGGCRVPARLVGRFRGRRAWLESHRGHDPGSLVLARALARAFGATLVATTVSRLVVETNRSPGHPALFSAATRGLPHAEKEWLLARYYRPHRQRAEQAIRRALETGARVVHLAVHTFTPVLDGAVRRADVGLLYDPKRAGERRLSIAWQRALGHSAPELRARRNYPYRGTADGLTTFFRRRFSTPRYLGIELEVNQRFPAGPGAPWRALRAVLIDSLAAALGETARRAPHSRRRRRGNSIQPLLRNISSSTTATTSMSTRKNG